MTMTTVLDAVVPRTRLGRAVVCFGSHKLFQLLGDLFPRGLVTAHSCDGIRYVRLRAPDIFTLRVNIG